MIIVVAKQGECRSSYAVTLEMYNVHVCVMKKTISKLGS